jgi:predicted GH43/DUF377 family glycosyl hydrolase
MKWNFVLLSLIILFPSCNLVDSTQITDYRNDSGNLLLKFESSTIPAGIVNITATLTRQGFNPISANMNLINDSTAEISFYNIAVGVWHLLVQAKDESDILKYQGETDVNVIENKSTEVYLTLIPTSSGTGTIHIIVNWGIPVPSPWIDYSNNPVLSSKNTEFDNQGISQAKIYYNGEKYLMWYVGLANGVAHTLYAESLDGISWIRSISQPVLYPGNPGSWDAWAVAPGPVIKDGNTYKMLYLGYSDPNGQFHIGLATSEDGMVWQKYPTPVLVGSANWERQISPHSILKIDNLYYLYYIGRSNVNRDRIGLAISNDGISWSKYAENPILMPTQNWEGSGISWPSVIYEQGVFKMVYMNTSYGANSFGMATSNDGKNWTKLNTNPIFSALNTYNGWANSDISYPSFIKVNSEYRIYYSGWKDGKYSIGFTKLNQ